MAQSDSKRLLDLASQYDVLAADYLSKNYEFPETFIQCIEAHNGPWRNGKDPGRLIELLFHYSDMIVSDIPNERILLEPTKELLLPKIIQEIKYGVQNGEKYTIHMVDQ